MRRGEIWVGNLSPSRGKETGKVRPVLILQADEYTEAGARLVVVLPLSSSPYEGHPLHVPVTARERLLVDSQIMVEQPRTLDRARLRDGPLARLRPEEMILVEKTLLAVLGIF